MTPLFALLAPLLLAATTPAIPINDADLGSIKAFHGAINPTKKAGEDTTAFFAVTNSGPDTDTLTGLSCPNADVTSLVGADGKPVGNVTIPPMQTITFNASGDHMLLHTTHFPIHYGAVVPCTLSFTNVGDIQILLFSTAPRD